jgi:hypothetical protein
LLCGGVGTAGFIFRLLVGSMYVCLCAWKMRVFFVKGARCGRARADTETKACAETVDDCYAYFDG